MTRYLYGNLYKNKKFTIAFAENDRLLLVENQPSSEETFRNCMEINESDLESLKRFVTKACEVYKEDKKRMAKMKNI